MKITNAVNKIIFKCKYGRRTRRDLIQVDNISHFPVPDKPYVFTSTLCREQHFRMPLYTYWCQRIHESPHFHRKQWEFVFICQALYERGYLQEGKTAIGFGVGKEPLACLFASCGVNVLATDLEIEKAKSLGWVSSNQHSNNLSELNEKGICTPQVLQEKVKFQNVDMNHIPNDLGKFDFCWSSCALEHLGSLSLGLDFIYNSLQLLKPGGIAVHTTEFNVNSNDKTIENNSSFVIYRRRDIEDLVKKLTDNGFIVEPVDYTIGNDKLEQYIDVPPYHEPHIRLQLAHCFISTSIGIIIKVL